MPVFFIIIAAGLWQLYSFYKDRSGKGEDGGGKGGAEQIEQKQEEAITDENNKFYKKMSKAVEERSIELCAEFAPPAGDECVYNIANASGDKKFCQEIKDEEIKKRCLGLFIYQEAINGGNVESCGALTISDFRIQCYEEFFWRLNDAKDCSSFPGDLQTKCADIVRKKISGQTGDEKICEKISDNSLKEDCLVVAVAKEKDSDQDGLPDSQEISYGMDPFKADTDGDGVNDWEEMSKYGTNPRAADTDGDGYGDGDEVKRGYNPAGEGKLK